MSVGGTGDVLAGITAGLLAKKAVPFNAARISAFINGSAGDLAFEKNSYGLVATTCWKGYRRCSAAVFPGYEEVRT